MVLPHSTNSETGLDLLQGVLPPGCKSFGRVTASKTKLENRLNYWREVSNNFVFLLVLSGTKTAEIDGISAAGSTSKARRYTAIADAELVLRGPGLIKKFPLPALPGGVTPALITYVASRWIGVDPLVLAVGLTDSPPFPHLRLEAPFLGPSSCITTGKAMDSNRVKSLLHRGFLMGIKMSQPLLLAECVPGGTTTAQAVLSGMGLPVQNLIGGSAIRPPVELKSKIVEEGLRAANLGNEISAIKLISTIGDPFQALATGLLLGTRKAGQQILLGGGSQMLAVLALALQCLDPEDREEFASGISLGTTSWLFEASTNSPLDKSSIKKLMHLIEDHFDVDLLGLVAGLHFNKSRYKALKEYELGYVKEGVGAGALTLVAQIQGADCGQLVDACDLAMDHLFNK